MTQETIANLKVSDDYTDIAAQAQRAREGLLTVRDARSGRVLQRIADYEGDRLIAVAFGPDGRTLVTGGRSDSNMQESVLRWRRD